jgi:hypothetical protein
MTAARCLPARAKAPHLAAINDVAAAQARGESLYLFFYSSTWLQGTAILSYGLRVTEPGEYRMSIRTRRDIEGAPRANDQANDVFVRMDRGPWVKVSHKTPWDQWGKIKHFSFETGLKDAVFSLTSVS